MKMILWDDCTPAERVERYEQCVRVLEGLSPHQRRKHFDMSDWVQVTDCGTVACAAGFCGLDPWFHERGLELAPIIKDDQLVGYDFDNFSPDGFFGNHGCAKIFVSNWLMESSVRDVIKALNRYVEFLKKTQEVTS